VKPPTPTLLLITDLTVCPDLEKGVESALEGGVKHLLLRIKSSPQKETLSNWAKKLHPLLKRYQAHLLISAELETALAFDGVGLHLPERSIPTQEARKRVGSERLLGRSCHDLKGALQAMDEGADYVTLSPLFATRSHPEALPLGAAKFREIRAAIPGPVLALGGIDANNLAIALQSGADGVGMIRGILNHPSPKKVAGQILKSMQSYHPDLG
jgi:thiamine-phosphate diphosphorylase